jgi:uncharacterized iron-regulated membrane protein
MKIKYNDKQYCLSRCAKDKIQTFIIEPLSLLLIIGLIYIGLTILGLVGGQLYVWFPEVFSMFSGIFSLSIDAMFIAGIMLTIVIILPIVVVLTLAGLIISINDKINEWINTKYEATTEKSCTLLEECT